MFLTEKEGIQKENQMSTIFTVGFPFENQELQFYEMREILITIDTETDEIKHDHITLMHAIKSNSSEQKFISNIQRYPYEKNS